MSATEAADDIGRSRFLGGHRLEGESAVLLEDPVDRRAKLRLVRECRAVEAVDPLQYSRMAVSKVQTRRISITSYSRARSGGNAW